MFFSEAYAKIKCIDLKYVSLNGHIKRSKAFLFIVRPDWVVVDNVYSARQEEVCCLSHTLLTSDSEIEGTSESSQLLIPFPHVSRSFLSTLRLRRSLRCLARLEPVCWPRGDSVSFIIHESWPNFSPLSVSKGHHAWRMGLWARELWCFGINRILSNARWNAGLKHWQEILAQETNSSKEGE